MRASGRTARTCTLAVVALRGVLKAARTDGCLETLPVEGIEWMKTEKPTRPLFTPADLQRFIDAAAHATKNAVEFCDYIRFLQYTGAREQEALKVRWADADFLNRAW